MHVARLLVLLGDVQRRMLAVAFQLAGPRLAYVVTNIAARLIYRLLPPLRIRCDSQCHAVLAGHVADADLPHIAERSFVHRARNFTDLLLAPRWLLPGTYKRFGGVIPDAALSEILSAQGRGQPVILATAYFGSFDLLPIFLGHQGVRPTVVYRPHANHYFDAYRTRVRSLGGCRMMHVRQSATGIADVLSRGGSVAIVADHHFEKRGAEMTLLGIPTRAPRSVGLLAWRYGADVAIAALRRVDNRFCFELGVLEVLKYAETAKEADPVEFVSSRYVRAVERMILSDPAQYFWAYARWGEEFVRLAIAARQGLGPESQ